MALIFHIDAGNYDGTSLNGLNVAPAVHTPGPIAEGNWSVAAYIDQRASDKQTEALGAIFTGGAGGPMAQLAPLIGKNLGVRKVPITYRIEGKNRSVEIPNILHMSVDPLPTAHPSGEMWANSGHPVSPDKLTFAVGAAGNTYNDHGMHWDNSGRTDTTRQSAGQVVDEGAGALTHPSLAVYSDPACALTQCWTAALRRKSSACASETESASGSAITVATIASHLLASAMAKTGSAGCNGRATANKRTRPVIIPAVTG